MAVANNNEKIVSLTKYLEDMKQKLSSAVPARHEKAPIPYQDFLRREIKKTESTLAKLRG